jgi:ABC-2 type transport system permease protein
MSWKKIYAVIRREYVERVRTKAFWIGTLLVPIFFLGYIAIQIASFKKTGGERTIAVLDLTGHFFAPLQKDLAEREAGLRKKSRRGQGVHWILQQRPLAGSLEATKDQLRGETLKKKIDGYLVLEPALLEKDQAEYYGVTVSEFVAMSQLQDGINAVRLLVNLDQRGLPPELSTELEKRVDLKTLKVTAKGSTEEKGAGIFAAIIFMVLMYTTFFMYGFQNLRGVIEEKTNRIVEVIIASVRPTELMLGKILGIGLVGLTQYIIWSVIAMNLSLPGVASAMASGEMGVPTIPVSMIVYFILFFLFGYFLYASIYTAIGAPFNTDQEAQQLAMIPGLFMVGCWAFYPAVLNNPNGTIAVFVSLFPLTSPLMMFLRTAVAEPPFWQVLLSMAILAVSTVGIAWAAGRIYRVGILMYGKKPTIPEIIRWIRYTPGETPQPAAAIKN